MKIDDRRLPSHYTGCEVYRGHVIAIWQGNYACFDARNPSLAAYLARCFMGGMFDG